MQLGCHTVAVVQYTFTHKQYIEQHNRRKQYIEQHSSLIRKSADRDPFLSSYTLAFALQLRGKKTRENLNQGSRRVPVLKYIFCIFKNSVQNINDIEDRHFSRKFTNYFKIYSKNTSIHFVLRILHSSLFFEPVFSFKQYH